MGEAKTFLGSIVSAKYLRLIGVSAAAVLFVISALVLAPVCKSQDDTFAAPTPSTTTLAMTTPSVSLSLALNDAAGTFAVSDPASFSVTTNNYTGYALSIRAKVDDANSTKLVNGNYALNSIAAATADGTGFSVGDWGYKPSKLNSVDNTDFLPAPTYAGNVLNATTTANSTADNYSLALAAKADYTTITGTYSNTFVLTAVPNPVNYTITYDKNTTDNVTNMPATQTGALSDSDIIVSSTVPTRAGYKFYRWCEGDVTYNTTIGYDTCSGTTYTSGAVYSTSMQASNNLSLKAMWRKTLTIYLNANGGTGAADPIILTASNGYYYLPYTSVPFSKNGYVFSTWSFSATDPNARTSSPFSISFSSVNYPHYFNFPSNQWGSIPSSITIYAHWGRSFDQAFANAGKSKSGNYYKMQDMTSNICSTVASNQTGSLIDTRDSTVYTIGKMNDGRCWLLDNLALDLTNSTVKNNLTTSTTNVTDTTALTRLKSGGGSTSDRYPTSAVANWGTSSSYSYSQPLIDVTKKDVVPTEYNGTADPIKTQVVAGNWKIGVYYNYCAASVGTYCWGNGTSYSGSPNSDPNTSSFYDIPGDICPYGWRIPTAKGSSSDGEYDILFRSYGSNRSTFRQALHLPLSGSHSGSQGSTGYTWASTWGRQDSQWILYYYGTSSLWTGTGYSRASGFTVRCVAK